MQDLPYFQDDGVLSTDGLIALEGGYRIDSLVAAFESRLMTQKQHEESEKVVLAVEAIEREINNGGFSQFFFNSSRKHAYFAPFALRAIGALHTAELVEKAIFLIAGNSILEADELRQKVEDADEELEDQLSELNGLYYQGKDEPIVCKLFDYIKINRRFILAT